jgi:hypothetical protein
MSHEKINTDSEEAMRAPSLLAALREVVNALSDHIFVLPPAVLDAYTIAKEAIQQATGEVV